MRDTPSDLNAHLFRKILEKSGAERLTISCQMTNAARVLVWSGTPKDLP